MRILFISMLLTIACPLFATPQNIPSFYDITFGMTKAEVIEILQKNKALQPPAIKEKSEKIFGKTLKLLYISTDATAEQHKKWEGLRSVELMLFNDKLVKIDIFVYCDGGQPFQLTMAKLSKFLGTDVSNGQFFVKDFLVKTASNHLDIVNMKLAVEIGLISKKHLEAMRAFAKKLEEKKQENKGNR